MKIIKQIFYILLFYIIGEIISLSIRSIFPGVFIPGTIIGMFLLVIALLAKWLNKENVEDVGTFLTNNMAFFFVPAAVSVVEYFDLLRSSLLRILLLIIISIVFSFFAIALSVRLTLFLQSKWKRGRKHE